MPKTKFEKPIAFDDLFAEAQQWEGGFTVHTPDSTYSSFIDDLLDQHFLDRDKTEYLGPEITDADIFKELLAGEYVTPHDTVLILEHKPPTQQTPKNDMAEIHEVLRAPAEPTSFIPIKSTFIGLPDGERDYTILPIPSVEDTPS